MIDAATPGVFAVASPAIAVVPGPTDTAHG